MTTTVLMCLSPSETADYSDLIAPACREVGVEARAVTVPDNPEDVEFVVASPAGELPDFSALPNLKAVLSIWAGVEKFIGNPQLAGVPLCRMVDIGLTEAMREYVTGHVMRYHLGMDAHFEGQDGVWRNDVLPPFASSRSVGILGMGALGSACAEQLLGIGFRVHGWSRRTANVPGVTCRSGPEGLRETLEASEILVTLLPDTPSTENTLNADTLAWLPKAAMIINPGRGPLIDDEALLAALDSGQVGHATLDVFRQEPLPVDHPYWAHSKVTVTPHIAAATRPETAVKTLAENIRRGLAGEELLYLVDLSAGY